MTEQDKQALIKHFCSRDCGEAAKDCTIMPCHEIELIQEFPTTEADTDTISREKAIEALCAVCGKACDKSEFAYNAPQDEQVILCPEHYCLCTLPSAQSETAKRIVGKSRGGMTLWYQCDMCNEPVDEQDNYCRGCGRRLIDG